MSYEDFTTFTELDPNSDITIDSSTQISIDTMVRNITAWVYKDYGVDHFTDFEHLFYANLITAVASGSYASLLVVWGLANTPSTYQDMIDNNLGLWIAHYRSQAIPYNFRLYLGCKETGNSDYEQIAAGSEPIPRYFTVERNGASLTNKIYTDSDRTILEDTLSCVCGVTALRYLESVASWDYATGSPAVTITSQVKELDIQETPTPTADKNIPNYFNSQFVTHH